jgi:hypothetical protein
MKIQPGEMSHNSTYEQLKFPQTSKKTRNHQKESEIASEEDGKLSDNTASSFQPNEQALQSILSGTGIAFSALGDFSGKTMRLTDSKLPLPRRITIAGRNSLFYPRRQRVENPQNEAQQNSTEEQAKAVTQSSSNCTDAIPEREVKDKENQSLISPNCKESRSMKPKPQDHQDEQFNSELKYDNKAAFKAELASDSDKNSQNHKNKGKSKGKEQRDQETEAKQSTAEEHSHSSDQNEYNPASILPNDVCLNSFLNKESSSVSHDWKYFGTIIRKLLDLHANDERRIKELEHENVLLLNRITNCEREAASEREITRKEIQQLHTELSKSEKEIRNLQDELREQKKIYKEETESLKNQLEMLQNKANCYVQEKAAFPLNADDEEQTNRCRRLQQKTMKSMGEDSKVSATSSDIDHRPIFTSSSSKQENSHNRCFEMMATNSINNKWEPIPTQQSNATCSPCSTKHSVNSNTPSPSNRGKLFREPERDIFNQSYEASHKNADKLDISGHKECRPKASSEKNENHPSTSFEVQPQSLEQILSCEIPISSQTSRGATRYMSFYDPTFKPQQSSKTQVEEEADWRRLTLTAETPNRYCLSKSTENPRNDADHSTDPCDALLSELREELRGPRYRNMRDAWQNLFKPTCNRLKPSLFYQAIRKIPAGKHVSQDVLEQLFQRIVPTAKETPKDLWEETIAMGWEHFVRLYQGNLQY